MLKYLNSYTFLSLFEAITLNQSLTLCFFKYFFVRYFKYLLLMADSEETVTEFLSEDTETASPKAPALPPTLIRSVRNCSNDAMSMMASSTCALCVRGNRTDVIYRMIIESLNVSLRFATVREREYTNLPIRARTFLLRRKRRA